jgi:rod shape-determining protein MreC
MKAKPPRYWQTAMLVLIAAGLIFLSFGGYLKPALSTASSPLISVQQWISSRYMAVYEFLTVPRDVATLRQRNAELENEVSNLQTQVIQLQQQLREADVMYALLDFARSRPQNEYVASTVIGRDPSPFLHYLYIDQGSDSGLRHGMPVVTQQGLVGRVDAVTASGARVQLITDPGSSVNVRLQSIQTEAIVAGSVTGDITLGFVPQDVVTQPGDLILTSGLGGAYPTDIVVGQVISVRKLETELFQTASVQPVVDFASLRAVLVITNFRPMNVAPLIPTPIP